MQIKIKILILKYKNDGFIWPPHRRYPHFAVAATYFIQVKRSEDGYTFFRLSNRDFDFYYKKKSLTRHYELVLWSE